MQRRKGKGVYYVWDTQLDTRIGFYIKIIGVQVQRQLCSPLTEQLLQPSGLHQQESNEFRISAGTQYFSYRLI